MGFALLLIHPGNVAFARRVFKCSVEEVDLSGFLAVDAEWLSYLGSFWYLRVLKLADCKNVDNGAVWPLSGKMLELPQS